MTFNLLSHPGAPHPPLFIGHKVLSALHLKYISDDVLRKICVERKCFAVKFVNTGIMERVVGLGVQFQFTSQLCYFGQINFQCISLFFE